MGSLLLSSCATTHTDSGGIGQVGTYGPLAFNHTGGGDFYVSQNGHFVPAEFRDGAIEIHLHGAPFQIGYNGEQLNLCLAEVNFPEVTQAISKTIPAFFICPTYSLLNAFDGKSWKVSIFICDLIY